MRQLIGIIMAIGMLGMLDMFIGIDICGMALIELSRGRLQDGYITELEGIIASSSLRGKSMIRLPFFLR